MVDLHEATIKALNETGMNVANRLQFKYKEWAQTHEHTGRTGMSYYL